MQSQSSLPHAGTSPEDSAKRNQAAIALAEAMARARTTLGADAVSSTPGKPSSTARLEAMRVQLAPLYAAIPRDVELFDLALVASDKPKLFVDIIAFIEMTPDNTAYRFVQETRSGRSVLLESDDEQKLRDAVTDYIARRLIDRERALAAASHVDAPTTVANPAKPASVERLIRTDGPRIVASPAALIAAAAAPAAALQQTASKVASPAMPQNANQAFERWTNALAQPEAAPEIAHQNDHAPNLATLGSASFQAPAKVNAGAEEELAAVRRELAEITALAPPTSPEVPKPPATLSLVAQAAETVIPKEPTTPTVTTVQMRGPAIKAAPIAEVALAMQADPGPLLRTSALATAAATATAVSRPPYKPRPESQSGRWLWPLLAMMVGIGLGALLLYLYAANILKP